MNQAGTSGGARGEEDLASGGSWPHAAGAGLNGSWWWVGSGRMVRAGGAIRKS